MVGGVQVSLDPPNERFFICVSSYAPGSPLEDVSSQDWPELVPQVADLLDALRTIAPPAEVPNWASVLLHEFSDKDGRVAGWRSKLASQPDLLDGYRRSRRRLEHLCGLPKVADATPTLLHCDLINRNVHVVDGVISGVFDWGCQRWGDHLFELGWFTMWAPWHPNLDIGLLEHELTTRWGEPVDADQLTSRQRSRGR